jgi:hypothetical protein
MLVPDGLAVNIAQDGFGNNYVFSPPSYIFPPMRLPLLPISTYTTLILPPSQKGTSSHWKGVHHFEKWRNRDA